MRLGLVLMVVVWAARAEALRAHVQGQGMRVVCLLVSYAEEAYQNSHHERLHLFPRLP